MRNERLATLSASIGAGLLFGTAGFHMTGYSSVVSRAPDALQPLMGAVWVSGGVSLALAALLTIVATPLFMVRRRALLYVAALTPLSIAVLQIVYLGFVLPTAVLLIDTAVVVIAGALGHARQPAPMPAA